MNNITTIADHVLIPHQADWTTPPDLTRMWRSSIDQSLAGNEDRLSVRSEAWMRLNFYVHPFNHIERARFDDRMRAALRAGKMAVPFWGRGVPTSADAAATDTSLVLERADHRIAAGSYIFVQSDIPAEFDTWDVCLVDSVASTTLNLSAGLNNSYSAGTFVRPLLFGKPITNPFEVRNSARGIYQVSIQFDGRQISAFAYDDFEDYSLGLIASDLNGGNGWAGPWVLSAA